MDSTCGASAAAAGSTIQVCFPAARAAVLDNLNRQREEGRLCDLSIQVQGQVFRAHRCVLAASSPYFHDQVLLKNVTTVSLPSVLDPLAFESVLSSAYTGQLSIVHDDIVNYVTVASFLQMWHVVDKCTELLKRPRPSVDAAPGEAAATAAAAAPHRDPASRQQSPSSTDCLNVEREGRRRERKPDALPPLATWRRPQQFPRWGRPRPSSAQNSADAGLDALPSYPEGDYPGGEEAWLSGHAKSGHFSHDGPGHNSRLHGGFPSGEGLKQKARFQQRGAPVDRNRGSRESDEGLERRKNERREIEADEGVGEETVEKEGFTPTGHHEGSNNSAEIAQTPGTSGAGTVKDKFRKDVSGSDVPAVQVCQAGDGDPGPSWQSSPWSQQDHRSQEVERGSCSKDEEEDEEEEDVDFECLAEGTFDEIEDGTGQISQRSLVLTSPDFTAGGSEPHWPSTSSGQGGSLTPSSTRHMSSSSAAFQPHSSPPTPSSSSSSVSLAGAPYTGKVHFCHCGKAYTLKSMRDRHVKMQHLNLRPFGCPVCTKSFKMKHHLTKHLKTHGGLRPYECGLCGKKVVWRDSFLRHQARCERLASSSSANGNAGSAAPAAAAAADVDDGYSFEFDEGDAFLAGQVKVEEVDFHDGVEDEMMLGGVSGVVDELRTHSLNAGGHVFKQEASEGFSGS